MKQTLLLQNLYLGTRNLLYSPIFRPTLTLNNGNSKSLISPSSASLLKQRFFTSKKDPSIENSTHSLPDHIDFSQTHNKDVPTGDDEVTKKGTSLAQENAIECLSNLIAGDDNLKLLVARSFYPIAEVLVSDGFLNRTIAVLNCGVLGGRIAAAKAVYDMDFNFPSTIHNLKMQIEKYLEGDEEAIPSIFEAILKRKLAGKHDESDDELMNEFRQKPLDVSSDREFDSESESD